MQYWQCYQVMTNDQVLLRRFYDTGHSMKCKWTAFLNDLSAHGTPGKWWVAEDTDTRKVIAYDDTIVRMTVFQLVTLDALMQPPIKVFGDLAIPSVGEQCSLGECIANGTHLTDCDDDGYCNFCGEQDASVDELVGG